LDDFEAVIESVDVDEDFFLRTSAFGTKQTLILGGGNRIVACNRYYKLIYIFSIFNVPANVPADLLDAIELLWTRLSAFGTKQTFNF